MSIGLKQRTKESLQIAMLSVLYIAMQLLLLNFERMQFTIFNGVISSLQYGICLLMLRVDRKKGLRNSIILMGLSILLLVRALIVIKKVGPLPGLCNGIFYMITLIVLAKYHLKQERDSVTDILTGVLNRRGLYKHLNDRIENEKNFSVVYISLDNFKFINDNYGHAYGDELMRKITRRVKKKLGEDGTVSRIGGAEFVVAISGELNAEETANEILEVIREKSSLVVDYNTVDCYMTCYAGLSTYPKDANDYESLIKYADIAMYEAMSKKSKKAYVFDEDMAAYMNRQIEVEKLIKDGLEKDYFYLVYQPQYHLNGKVLRGFETLIRMKTPEGQFVSPGEFIPVAEKGEMILQIDDYVLRRAMKEFKDIVSSNQDLIVSINVSAKNIGNLGFIEKVKAILDETGFPAKNLEIEITEYCMVDSMDVTIDNITNLRAMGIQIALDDFGTGYTSLNYVAKLPINLLKVDKSLVDDIEKSEKNREFVHTIISMGHLMGCEVISEGVEDETQLNYLKEDGCDFVQGYVWGKPLDYKVARELAVN